jgi:hypothetical protein
MNWRHFTSLNNLGTVLERNFIRWLTWWSKFTITSLPLRLHSCKKEKDSKCNNKFLHASPFLRCAFYDLYQYYNLIFLKHYRVRIRIFSKIPFGVGPGVAYWFRHCATSRKVSGSIAGGVAGDFFRSYRLNHMPWGRLSL